MVMAIRAMAMVIPVNYGGGYGYGSNYYGNYGYNNSYEYAYDPDKSIMIFALNFHL